MPSDLLPAARQSRLGAGHSKLTQGLSPNLPSFTCLRVLKDDQGMVTAKSFFRVAATHCVLFIVAEYKYVLEAEIPEDCFLGAAKDWEVPSGYLVVSQVKSLVSMIGIGCFATTSAPAGGAPSTRGAGFPDLEHLSFSEAGRLFRSGALVFADLEPAIREELWKSSREGIGSRGTGGEGAATTSSAPGEPASAPQAQTLPAEGKTATLIPPPRNVPEYLLFVNEILSVVPLNRVFKGREEFPAGLLSGMIAAPSLFEVMETAEPFRGVTCPGFAWRHTTKEGRTCTVRNLGGRKVRVEIKMAIIRDPLLPLLGVNY